MRDFDDNEFPLAYLITFCRYGTWLHGDERLSMSRKQNIFGTPRIEPRPRLQQAEARQLKHSPVILNARQRHIVEDAIRDVCLHRTYLLRAVHVRTNHVHTIVSAMVKPEPILNGFKSYSTRALRRAGLLNNDIQPWARHGSTIYLWKERDVATGMAYVLLEQGGELPRIN